MAEKDEMLRWELVSEEHIVKDEWIDFRKVGYRLPDGSFWSPFYTYSRRDYVVIVASDEEGKFLCVRQFRQGIGEVTTEFPAGGIERNGETEYRDGSAHASEDGRGSAPEGDPAEEEEDAEQALDAARRELMEETGYVSNEWEHLITVPSNATITDNIAYVYRARNCRRAGSQDLDETEFLNVERKTPEEIEQLIAGGKFQQSVHIMAWLLANRKEKYEERI